MSPSSKNMRMTAVEYLDGPEMDFLSRSLEKQEKSFTKDLSTAEIGAALFARGSEPRDKLLAPGEFEKLIDLLQTRYPQMFGLWVEEQVLELMEPQQPGINKEQFIRSHRKIWDKELRPVFSAHEKYKDIEHFIDWD